MFSFGFLLFFSFRFFFFNDTATTEIYTLSLHDALPICRSCARSCPAWARRPCSASPDRKSTRLNSSHVEISYAVFCLKKKNKHKTISHRTTQHYNKNSEEYNRTIK